MQNEKMFNKWRELEKSYVVEEKFCPYYTHITTPETWETIKSERYNHTNDPTLLAIIHSKNDSQLAKLSYPCNGGSFVYMFNHSAEWFLSSAQASLALDGIRARSGTDSLVLIETRFEQVENTDVAWRFLPLHLKHGKKMMQYLRESEKGLSVIDELMDLLDHSDICEQAQFARNQAQFFRTVLTSIGYTFGLKNFAMYSSKISDIIFYGAPRNVFKAGHRYVVGDMDWDPHENIQEYTNRLIDEIASKLRLPKLFRVNPWEVFESLKPFFQPSVMEISIKDPRLYFAFEPYGSDILFEYMKRKNPKDSVNITKAIYGLYHLILAEDILSLHENKLETVICKTAEPNGTNENFGLVSPGANSVCPAKIFIVENNKLNQIDQRDIRFLHDCPFESEEFSKLLKSLNKYADYQEAIKSLCRDEYATR